MQLKQLSARAENATGFDLADAAKGCCQLYEAGKEITELS